MLTITDNRRQPFVIGGRFPKLTTTNGIHTCGDHMLFGIASHGDRCPTD